MQLPKMYAHVHLHTDSMNAEADTTSGKKLN